MILGQPARLNHLTSKQGEVVCLGDLAPRHTVFADERATASIEWDGIFVSTPMRGLAHAVWQFAPVCDDAERSLGGWPGPPFQPEG